MGTLLVALPRDVIKVAIAFTGAVLVEMITRCKICTGMVGIEFGGAGTEGTQT